MRLGVFLAAVLMAGTAGAEPVRLAPADPQPEGLEEGLGVAYAYPRDVRLLVEAERYRDEAEPGKPLIGFDYIDTGGEALTSGERQQVVAFIEGYVRFDQAGLWKMQWHSNDGLEVRIGGEQVYRHDGRHGCETLGWKAEFEVPEPGWYPLEATWFQRLGTSCLLMEWAPPGGEMGWTPNAATGFAPR